MKIGKNVGWVVCIIDGAKVGKGDNKFVQSDACDKFGSGNAEVFE